MKRIFLIMIAFGVCFFEVPVDAYEKSLKNVKVVIDAGHGGFDNGAIEYGYYEDNKSDYDNYDDAYDAFEDDEDSWDDY